MIRRPPRPTPFPYTTLFRSHGTITAANLIGPLAGHPLSDLVAALSDGGAYANVHTNRSEEHTSDQSPCNLVCRLLLEKKKKKKTKRTETSEVLTAEDTRERI